MTVDNGQPKTRRKLLLAILGGAAAAMLVGAPDGAEAATDFVLYTRQGEEAWQVNQAGRYFDRFVRRDGRWWYAENHPVAIY